MGFRSGIAIFLYGLILLRRSQYIVPRTKLPAAASDPLDAECLVPAQHIVHLTTVAAPTRSSEMTQQQKIAAALTRAGIANPAAWSSSAPSSQATAERSLNPAQPMPSSHLLVLCAGSFLALASLLMFLLIR